MGKKLDPWKGRNLSLVGRLFTRRWIILGVISSGKAPGRSSGIIWSKWTRSAGSGTREFCAWLILARWMNVFWSSGFGESLKDQMKPGLRFFRLNTCQMCPSFHLLLGVLLSFGKAYIRWNTCLNGRPFIRFEIELKPFFGRIPRKGTHQSKPNSRSSIKCVPILRRG